MEGGGSAESEGRGGRDIGCRFLIFSSNCVGDRRDAGPATDKERAAREGRTKREREGPCKIIFSIRQRVENLLRTILETTACDQVNTFWAIG